MFVKLSVPPRIEGPALKTIRAPLAGLVILTATLIGAPGCKTEPEKAQAPHTELPLPSLTLAESGTVDSFIEMMDSAIANPDLPFVPRLAPDGGYTVNLNSDTELRHHIVGNFYDPAIYNSITLAYQQRGGDRAPVTLICYDTTHPDILSPTLEFCLDAPFVGNDTNTRSTILATSTFPAIHDLNGLRWTVHGRDGHIGTITITSTGKNLTP